MVLIITNPIMQFENTWKGSSYVKRCCHLMTYVGLMTYDLPWAFGCVNLCWFFFTPFSYVGSTKIKMIKIHQFGYCQILNEIFPYKYHDIMILAQKVIYSAPCIDFLTLVYFTRRNLVKTNLRKNGGSSTFLNWRNSSTF
jgi:hypothetical protein